MQVFAVCTDNENKMVKIKALLRENYPKLMTYECSAHFRNLFEKDASPKTILKHTIEVQKYFKNHDLLNISWFVTVIAEVHTNT